MNKLRRIIVLLWAVALAAMAMLVVAAGLVTRKGSVRSAAKLTRLLNMSSVALVRRKYFSASPI